MDSLVSFFSVGITPTGNVDPFALRRQALGCIKILIDRATVRETMGKAIELGMSNERVVGLFDKVFVGMDPQLDRKLAIIKAVLAVAVSLLILGGCLGGCVYLIKLVF